MKIKFLKNEKALYTIILVEIFCLIIFIFLSTYLLRMQNLSQKSFKTASQLRYKSFLLADQLRQSSDDLTRMVRSYVATGNKRFEDYFWNILDIREGKKSRPVNYERIYWDFMTIRIPIPPFAEGKKVPLERLMKEAGFTEDEFQLLADAKKKSDDLVSLERIAINAMKGKFQDKKGDFSVSGEPDPKFARQLVFGEEYHKAKKNIMSPINVFLGAIDQRTLQNVTQANSQVQLYQLLMALVFGALVLNGILLLLSAKRHKKLMVGRLKAANYEQALEINERKQAEEMLKESEKKYRLIIENQVDLIVTFDSDGKLVFVSPSYCNIFGKSENELLGEKFTPLIHEDDRERVKQELEKIHKPPYSVYIEERILTKDGWKWQGWQNTAALNENGEVIEIIGVGRDISDRKQAEEDNVKLQTQLQQAQKMEAIGTLAGGIAHDFNNILGVIMGYTEMTLDNPGTAKNVIYNLKRVMKASERAKDMVNQILAFSRKKEQTMKSVNLGNIIKETITFLRSSIPTTVEIKSSIEKNMGLVFGNPTQINQVLMNLCTNAAYAMKEKGGLLEISLKEVMLDKDSYNISNLKFGIYQQLTVSDTGFGMSKEIIERIYEPYFTTKQVDEGTGMGLAVIYGIIKIHKGDISVFSEPEKGTTFNVYFPVLKISNTNNLIERLQPAVMGNNEKILFVDDEIILVDLGTKMLKKLGYIVESRNDSVDALKIFKADPDKYDLIITDMTMPNMTGVKLAEEIHKIKPEIPVVICTGFSSSINMDNFKDKGISALVMKPVVKSELSKVIREVLDKKKQ